MVSKVVLCTSRAGSSPSSPGVPRARVRSSLLAARESWRAPLLRGRRCCSPRATSHRTRENIYRCSRYMASGNKSTVFIFKWRVFNFCLVVSKEKGACRGILTAQDSIPLDSARAGSGPGATWARVLESGGASSRLVNNTTRVSWQLESRCRWASPRVQGCLEPSPLESRSGLGSGRLVNNTSLKDASSTQERIAEYELSRTPA